MTICQTFYQRNTKYPAKSAGYLLRFQNIIDFDSFKLIRKRSRNVIIYSCMMNINERKRWLENNKEDILKFSRLSIEEFVANQNLAGVDLIDKNNIENEIIKGYESRMNNYKREQSNCKEEICGIDLKPYLNKIKYIKDHEEMMFLLIKDNEVKKEIICKGGVSRCGSDEETEEVAKIANELKADIYVVHNHPLSVYAYPSGKLVKYRDTYIESNDYGQLHKYMPEIFNKYGVKMIDFAVVTEVDYYSLTQKGFEPELKNIGQKSM